MFKEVLYESSAYLTYIVVITVLTLYVVDNSCFFFWDIGAFGLIKIFGGL